MSLVKTESTNLWENISSLPDELKMIIGEFSVGHDKNQLKSIYKDATKEKFNFLKIDIEEPDDNKRFSHNFTGFYQIDDATPP